MTAPGNRRHDRKGRSKVKGRFLSLHHWLMESPAWQELRPVERCVYIEIASRYNGSNNGYVALSCRDAAARLGVSKGTVSRAITRLEALGFVEVMARGAFSYKVRHASEFRLTEYHCDRTHQMASKDFMSRRPEASKKQNAVSPRSVSGPVVQPLTAFKRQ